MAEEMCISEWGTQEHADMSVFNQTANGEQEPAADSGLCGLLGISSVSDKTSIGDAMALSYELNGNGQVARKICLSLAASYGIGTSLKKCMENVSDLLSRPSRHALDASERKRSVSVAIGSLDVATQSQKRRSPVFFTANSSESVPHALKIGDVLRALNVKHDAENTERIARHSSENDRERRCSYLRAVGWGFHALHINELTRREQMRSPKKGDGVVRISLKMSIEIEQFEAFEKQMDLATEALFESDDLPADPAMAIALVYRMCRDLGMDLATCPKFILFVGDSSVRTYHRLTTDGALELATLDEAMSKPKKRLLVACSIDEERAHTRDIYIPVPLKSTC